MLVYKAVRIASRVLVRLLPSGSAQISSIEVVIASSVLGLVFVHCGLVRCQCGLAKFEGLLPLLHSTVADLSGSLESLIRLEPGLEVHPVLSCVTEGLLRSQESGPELESSFI